MTKSRESWNKKEKEKKKQQDKKEKEQKKQERKSRPTGSLDDMFAYVDENGMITSTPPDPTKKKQFNLEDIEISTRKKEDGPQMEIVRKGIVAFFNDAKGFGFIKDNETKESVFVHANSLSGPIKENDKVSFEVEMGQKGPVAVKVKLM